MIMFAVRTMFWLGLVIAIIPVDNKSVDPTTTSAISPSSVASIANDAIGDVAQFCVRRPETCEQGYAAAEAFGQKALYASELLYKFMQNQFADEKQPIPSLPKTESSPQH